MSHSRILSFLAGILLLSIISCSKNNLESQTPPLPEPQLPQNGLPVEKNPPNTNYKPAFDGQTRIGSVITNTPHTLTTLTSSLIAPWGLASLPDGRLLVTERGGSMRIVSNSGNISAEITGIPVVNSRDQGGLLGLCIDPQFSINRLVYWVFSENVSGGTVTSVAKGKLSNTETHFENVSIIYRAYPAANSTNHYGGRILIDRNGYLLVSTGDRSGLATRPLAQSTSAALGKIIRITVNGEAVIDNPKFNGTQPLTELYSIGHRNPQGLALHPITGELWQSEHGPRGGDEINRIQPGLNFGWPTITYGIEYSGQAIGAAQQQMAGKEQPVYYWDPVISPSGMTFYKGNRIPEWENNLFIGALSGQHIVRLKIVNNKVVGEERLFESEKQRFRDLTQGIDGAIYAITDGGKLYKIDKK